MGGIDKFISAALSNYIKKSIPKDILKKVERELFLKEGMSIKLSIEHFPKFQKILKQNSTIDINKFHREMIGNCIGIEKSKEQFFIRILDLNLSNTLLNFLADSEYRDILSNLFGDEMTIPKVLKKSKIPKTSGYRKIENLIIGGIIVETGKVLSESKKISKYRCCFDEITIKFNKDKKEILCLVSKKTLENSSSISDFI